MERKGYLPVFREQIQQRASLFLSKSPSIIIIIRHHHHRHHHNRMMTTENATKKAKVDPSITSTDDDQDDQKIVTSYFREVQRLLFICPTALFSPSQLDGSDDSTPSDPIGNSIERMKSFFDYYGFRTSIVESPREGISIYKDSFILQEINDEDDDDDDHHNKHDKINNTTHDQRKTLLAMFGTHPAQDILESIFVKYMKKMYCLVLFCRRIRTACVTALERSNYLMSMVDGIEQECLTVGNATSKDDPTNRIFEDMETCRHFSSQVNERLSQLMQCILQVDHRIRLEQLQHEYERIVYQNGTYANAHVRKWLDKNNTLIKEIYYKHSHVRKYERFTIYLYDPRLDPIKPPSFIWMPGLALAIGQGPEAMAQIMTRTFWTHLLRRGYFATTKIQNDVSFELEKYFLFGILKGLTVPLLLNAHFVPTYPLCFYFHGKAGSGKSSLVRNFSYALNTTIEDFVDPEVMVRMVKQNLNKPYDVLELEFDLRPNNNDLSVMSIIQGRRLTMSQNKPGLVVVGLEEMASNRPEADPNQLAVTQLISQRFSGRKGQYRLGDTPRNSAKRGISGDASIIPLFTSNYLLEKPCVDAMGQLHMFSNLRTIKIEAISGNERKIFAEEYLRQAILDRSPKWDPSFHVKMAILDEGGDTRPLVRFLRMLAFYTSILIANVPGEVSCDWRIGVSGTEESCTISIGSEEMLLKVTPSKILVPLIAQTFDSRVSCLVEKLHSFNLAPPDELSAVLEFWLARTLAPAVIVSSDRDLVSKLRKAVQLLKNIHCIPEVDASQYKMTKSLYDPNDTPNLRDEILKLGRGTLVAIELFCETTDAQLCIREIIEDTPSMTAFSTEKSALHKSGLLFCCYCKDITPEIKSRASIIL